MRRNFHFVKPLKTKIKMKLNLIYNAKNKINTKWWKIKMKTNNLTQISLRNDPINRRMQGFSFWIFERRKWSSRLDFFQHFQSNFEIKYSNEAEMSCEYIETNDTRNNALNMENLKIDREHVLTSRRTAFKSIGFGRGRWSYGDIAINGSGAASFDRNDAIKLQSFDRKWRLQMRPCRSCEVRRCLKPSVGS